MSHLTRGAWIEISKMKSMPWYGRSHLTRGAWIEIALKLEFPDRLIVAPHTRCVD